jgi:hypothetical protein
LNEPGVNKTHTDLNKYTKIIEYKNIEIAILKMMLKEEGIYPKSFDIFYSIMKEHFVKNKDIFKKFIEDKVKEQKEPEILLTTFYSMKVTIDYEKLYSIFLKTKLKIDVN